MNVAPPGLAASAFSAAPSAGDESALSADRPFPGLRPFSFADRAFFFGRERQKFALYRLVEAGRFIAVIGSSGSGKSSLVLAGLRGLLADETANPGGSNWACLDMRPGASPLKRLANALARLSENDGADEAARRRDRIEYSLRQSSSSFESALKEAGGLGDRTLLLIVDQFEELFRFGRVGLGPRRAGIEEARARDEATQFVQILLDADRRRLEKVHVLITMRSDFIGDCAYFHGLSEAVSATQYLTPNLMRDQIEEVIRRPIEAAGASIEPELVERLINDCGDELDQLPVLQHCLMRLWDRAGAASATGPRRLTQQTYDDIGGMSDTLSRHADEILAECAGGQLAVSQAFRALSELDRDGRATRRALPFSKLLAETGVDESGLRAVLDRFRAPNCSFLVPPPALVPSLAADERIDIGHEALLRRWKKLSGEAGRAEATTDVPVTGWLKDERNDGERYRTLVSLLDGEGTSLGDPEGKKRWWDSLPRTAAWADRYGGRFAEVRKLIDDNIAAKRRGRRNRVLAAVAAILCLLVGVGFVYVQQQRQQREEAIRKEEQAIQQQKEARAKQEAIDASAMDSAKKMLESELQAFQNHTLGLEGAKSLATVSEQFLASIRKSNKTSAADLLWVEALDVEFDLQWLSGDHAKALVLATEARDAALRLTESDPSAPKPLQKLYESTLRVGAAYAAPSVKNYDVALREFENAEAEAQNLLSLSETLKAESETYSVIATSDLVDVHAKIGDIYKYQYSPKALDEYREALSTCEKALTRRPHNSYLLRNEGKALYRIAEYLRSQNGLDEARDDYRKAMGIQEALVEQNPADPSLKSNLAATYTHWGALENDAGNLELALTKIKQGVAIDEALVKADPSNPQWEKYLEPDYLALTGILEKLGRPKEALQYYQKSFDATRDLAIQALGDPPLTEDFAKAAKSLGDHSEGLARIEAYHSARRAWDRLLESKSPELAAAHFDDAMALGGSFHDAKDWPDEQAAYVLASKMARWNLEKDASETKWKERADAATGAAEAANGAPAQPSSAPQ